MSSLKNEQNEKIDANDDRCDKKNLHEQFKRSFINFNYRWVSNRNARIRRFFLNCFCFLFEFKLTSMIFWNRNNEKKIQSIDAFWSIFSTLRRRCFFCIEFNNLNWMRINQQRFRVDLYSDVMNRLNEKIELIDIEKKIIVLSFNHVDSFRYLKIKNKMH